MKITITYALQILLAFAGAGAILIAVIALIENKPWTAVENIGLLGMDVILFEWQSEIRKMLKGNKQ